MAKRLVKIATEFNIATATIVEFFRDRGFSIEDKPTSKVSDQMYILLKEKLGQDKSTSKKLTHVTEKGVARMVDITQKKITKRVAEAQAIVTLGDKILHTLEAGDFATAKGSVFDTARLAGIMAVKKTAELIPLCHLLPITSCDVDIQKKDAESLIIRCKVKTTSNTGVEMEALHGATVAALTIYDMCKAMSHDIEITDIYLLNKTGGKSDYVR